MNDSNKTNSAAALRWSSILSRSPPHSGAPPCTVRANTAAAFLSQPMMNLCPCAALRAPDAFPIPYKFVPWVQPSFGPYKKGNEDPKEKEMQFLLKFLSVPLRRWTTAHKKTRHASLLLRTREDPKPGPRAPTKSTTTERKGNDRWSGGAG